MRGIDRLKPSVFPVIPHCRILLHRQGWPRERFANSLDLVVSNRASGFIPEPCLGSHSRTTSGLFRTQAELAPPLLDSVRKPRADLFRPWWHSDFLSFVSTMSLSVIIKKEYVIARETFDMHRDRRTLIRNAAVFSRSTNKNGAARLSRLRLSDNRQYRNYCERVFAIPTQSSPAAYS